MAYEPVPAGGRSGASNLSHLQSVYYKKKALSRLEKKFVFETVTEKDQVPLQSGRTVQWFRYGNLAAATTPKSPEGGVGTSGTINSRTLSATVSQYTNFITVSDFLVETAIDPIVQQAAELLGYQAGLSVDTITRAVFDAEQSGTDLALTSSYLQASDFRNVRARLVGIDVEPMDDGYFHAFAHPYCTYDLVNDPAANGLADIAKRNDPSILVKPNNNRAERFIEIGGCKLVESTNVALVAGSPNKWRVYVFGKGAVGSTDLAGKGPSRIVDPSKQRFSITTIKGEKGMWDPEGVLGGAVSYNFKYVPVVLDGTASIGGSYRFRTMDAPSSIVA